ncbi:unnamed product [Ostreococcus tauri]|uniref:Unnamed product n=1 Tax=Ostreococcus tauri TaxID=70448 RepID=A0A090M8E8_OSTTA|nr:unnamed product [Ostreococcus tauri]CEG01394.1 unnamed product [Ostreococcus tauri]|eukprot:XP_022840932.1 unnamed product [Ostreococcus tauri]
MRVEDFLADADKAFGRSMYSSEPSEASYTSSRGESAFNRAEEDSLPSARSHRSRDPSAYARNARDPPVTTRRVKTSERSDESAWVTMRSVAQALASNRAASAAQRRRFCDVLRERATSVRGVYEIARAPGAVSALKRLTGDADADARRGACEATRALAKTELGASLLCSSDEELREAWGVIRLWEWHMALARVRCTFGLRAYAKCRVAFVASTALPMKASGEVVDKYLSRQTFFPLQSNTAPTFSRDVSILAAIARTLSRSEEDPDILLSALGALDEILSTINCSVEGIPLADNAMNAAARQLAKSTITSLAAIDPVDAFTQSEWTSAVRRPGLRTRLAKLVSRWICGTPTSNADGEEQSDSEDDEGEGGEDTKEKISSRGGMAHASVLDDALYSHLLALSVHESDANIREKANRILYDATLTCENKSIGKKVYEALIGNDNLARASALSWMAYLFVQHVRTVRAFVTIHDKEKWLLTKTTKYLLSDEVLRSAAKGLSENSESIRLGATRMLRAAWDAISATPTAAPIMDQEEEREQPIADNEPILVDERFTFRSRERWHIFVNNGIIDALCNMQRSRAPGAAHLADMTLDHFYKTEQAALKFLLAREAPKTEEEKREAMRRRIEEHKDDFKGKSSLAIVKTATDEVGEKSDKSSPKVVGDDVTPQRARWHEHRSKHKPIISKFTDVDNIEGDDLQRDGWRAKVEDYILAGGAGGRKTVDGEQRRGPYERAVLRESKIGIGAKGSKLPSIWCPDAGVGPYVENVDSTPKKSSARVFTRPSERRNMS